MSNTESRKNMQPFQKGITVTGIHEETRFDYPLFRERMVEKKDFERIAGMGFDHVRLLVDHASLIREKDFRLHLKDENWERLDIVLEWVKSCGLRAVICLRSAPGYCYRDAEKIRDGANTLFFIPGQRDLFIDLWRYFEQRYAGTEEQIAFELLDRVGFFLTFNNILQKGCGWEALVRPAVDAIRSLSVRRKIIVGTDTFGSCDGLPEIPVFPDDPDIIYSFQFFKPELFTKQAAYNHRVIADYSSLNHNIKSEIIRYPGIIPGMGLFLEKYPGYSSLMAHYKDVVIDDTVIEQNDFAPVMAFRKKYPQAELYAGSFAAVMYADPDSRKNWLSCVIRLFEKNGIGFCYYKYLGSRWGLVNIMQEDEVDEIALSTIFNDRGSING